VSRLGAILIGIPLVLLGCSRSSDVLRMIERGDHSLVLSEKYPRTGEFLSPGSPYEERIGFERSRIEEDSTLMNRLAAEAYPGEEDDPAMARFGYVGASLNEDQDELVLWYRGLLRDPRVNAGYRAQWVLDLDKGYLSGVYLSVVPLE
jgi:hypothetical protein